jgi:hypothetical protein
MMKPSPALGTWAWVRSTNGLLQWRDRWNLLGQACLYGIEVLPWELRRALRIGRRHGSRADLESLAPPDSRIARDAEELIAEAAGAMVVNHSHRTYAFAAAIAAHDRRPFDREVVYVAALLHDLYWERPNQPAEPHCFTLPAAADALSLATAQGWNPARRHALADAITLHLNIRPPRGSVESYLVFVGARLDVVGYRYWDLHPNTIAAIVHRHPRLNLKRECRDGFDRQSAANPGSRVHFQTRFLGSKWFARHAPFAE